MDDPDLLRDFGRLEERVRSLDSKFDRQHAELSAKLSKLGEDVASMAALAERGRGAMWLALLLGGGAFGGLVSWVVKVFGKGA